MHCAGNLPSRGKQAHFAQMNKTYVYYKYFCIDNHRFACCLRDKTQWWAYFKVETGGVKSRRGETKFVWTWVWRHLVFRLRWLSSCFPDKKKTNNHPTMSQRPPSSSYIRGVGDFFSFTHSHIHKSLGTQTRSSTTDFQNKSVVGKNLQSRSYFESAPAHFRPPFIRFLLACHSPPSPSLNAEFGLEKRFLLLIMVARPGCCGRCNFSRLVFVRRHRPLIMLFSRRCVVTTRAPSVVFFFLLLRLGSARARSNRRSPSAAVLGALANHSPHHSPRTDTQKKHVYFTNNSTPVPRFFTSTC